MSLATTLGALKDSTAIQMADVDGAFAEIMDGAAAHEDIKRFLALTMPLMGHAPLIAAGARALRSRMLRVEAPKGAIDVCGTGGDGAHTLNISTAVAFVVAGCGVPVAKHGNRAMSSKSGAADVLEALGVKLTGNVPTLERCLREAGVAFLFAQNHHPAMRHVALARRELGKRTIFNLLGPLSNPAGVKRQLMGVFGDEFVEPVAFALQELGTERACVVHGAGGLDELSFVDHGKNYCVIVDQGTPDLFVPGVDNEEFAEYGAVPYVQIEDLRGGDAAHNAHALQALLDNRLRKSAYENAVLLNATYALIAAKDIPTELAWSDAAQSLRSGAAQKILSRLIAISRSAP